MEDPFKGLRELLPILVFLLPGFVSSGIVEMLVVRKSRETFDKCVEALIFTTINLAVFFIARWLLELIPHVHFGKDNYFTAGNLTLMTASSVAIGIVCANEATNEHIFKRLRDRRITRKTLKVSTWNETFVSEQRWVIVHLKDDRRIYGWPLFYADDPADRAIYLQPASWLREDDTFVNDPRIGIFFG